ncbi:flavodoxin domain-containing protein [Streptomyces flavofungini]|uniref:Flavodoxin domain-containing protein n=1 Tax=Streptomyces flavofungini TaxID=68200 RepID=A0ABS0XGA1_9ACTN|nr:flavodoxin domain-containing protein [Streptomyces flavofungini]MBJ3811894.1 flavodoxin domain-containing protein [Streptomyces flavofungini]GHC52641.1 flavodoxin [Streptomyces flavofungini]
MHVLIGYATAHGSTREIATRLAVGLGDAGLKVAVRPMAEVDDEDAYDAFVLGSAVHGQAWLDEAKDFLRRNSDLLGQRPVWLFSVGLPDALRGPWKRMARKEESVITEDLPGYVPYREHRLMSGVIKPGQLSFAGRVVFRLMGSRYGDFRDWPAIDAWAGGIACELSGT